MATSTQYSEYPSVIPARRMFSWSGIFAGTFVFLAIETTFGVLGAAIFASATNPINIGFEIWMIILSIIALYFAGKTSSKLLYRSSDRNFGMYHGLVTFGMSIFASLLVIGIAAGRSAMSYAPDVTRGAFGMAAFISNVGEYWLFAALVLAMISAAMGGMHGIGTFSSLPQERSSSTKNVA